MAASTIYKAIPAPEEVKAEQLKDIPSYQGQGGKGARVKGDESGFEYVDEPFLASTFVPGKPGDGATVLRIPIQAAVTFPAGLTSSKAVAETAPTGGVSFSVQKDGVEFATVDFAASATTATFTAASETVFASGDVLSIVAPTPQDSTLADVGISLRGQRA